MFLNGSEFTKFGYDNDNYLFNVEKNCQPIVTICPIFKQIFLILNE